MDINTEETPTEETPTEEIDFKPEDMVSLRGTLYGPTHYTLLIRLNDNCNLDCSYCTMHSKDKKEHTPLDTIIDYIRVVFNVVDSIPEKFDSISYYFYGGEPTMYTWFEELVEEIHNLHQNSRLKYIIETQTNLTKPIQFFKRISKYNIKFICSYQNSAQNKLYKPFGNKHIDQYLHRAWYLMENDLTHGFDIMLEDPTSNYYINQTDKPIPTEIKNVYNQLKYIYRSIVNKGARFSIQMNTIDSVPIPDIYKDIYQDHKNHTEKLFITLKDNTEKVIAFNDIISNHDYNNFRFWYCDVGMRQFMLSFADNKPKVWWCMADMFAKMPSLSESLYDFIILAKETIGKKPQRCIHKRCSCELFIPKRRKK